MIWAAGAYRLLPQSQFVIYFFVGFIKVLCAFNGDIRSSDKNSVRVSCKRMLAFVEANALVRHAIR